MNLESLNLVELNAQEVQETEGGFLWAVGLIIAGVYQAAVVGTLAAGVVGSFQGGYNSVRNL
ncbi:bacteriocin [uncultured Flavobacterium sp.]|uniref:bacteriocin n=1 Tax=uncultured Flavobacterium sp. TaxID=165435 RepID=UPI0030CA139D